MAFGKKGRNERLGVLNNGGVLSARKAAKLPNDVKAGRMVDGVMYDHKGNKSKHQPGRGK